MASARSMLAAVAVAVAAALAACGDEETAGPVVPGHVLRIYSGMPLVGGSAADGRDIVAAERLALREAGRRISNYRIQFRSLNDASRSAGGWTAPKTRKVATTAARDPRTIAYLGDFNSAASEVSIPILNRAGILQVSPSNASEALTQTSTGALPEELYPSGERTFARVVPVEHVQAGAQAALMEALGLRKLYVVNDGTPDGKTIAAEVVEDARGRDIEVVANRAIDPDATRFRPVAKGVAASDADALFFGGVSQDAAIEVWEEVHAGSPRVLLFADDGVGDDTFAEAIGGGAGARTFVTAVPLAPSAYPPAGQRFFERFQRRYGRQPAPYAIYGYEAMSAVLEAIEDAGDEAGDRRAVVDAFFSIRDRRSVLGTYSIDEYGDPTLDRYGAYRVRDDSLVFIRPVRGGSQ